MSSAHPHKGETKEQVLVALLQTYLQSRKACEWTDRFEFSDSGGMPLGLGATPGL